MEAVITSWIHYVSPTFICFVVALLLAKLYIKIRSRFKITVNCWFCNQNARVKYADSNSWDCPNCGQYNGFTDDGDYNRDISSQHLTNNVQFNRQLNSAEGTSADNGLCQQCNDNQLIKVEKLAAFEPENEATFAEEMQAFQETLQETYRLCHQCEKNLRRILAEKKKMVLGLRLAQKGTTKLQNSNKQFIKPSHIRTPTSTKVLKQLTNIILFILAITNWMNVISNLKLNRENLHSTFGPITASIFLVLISHIAALTKVIIKYLNALFNIHLVEKTMLFTQTITILGAYMIGVDLRKWTRAFSDVVYTGIPMTSMFLAFGFHFLEGFKVTRKTYLLALWSAYSCLPSNVFSDGYGVYKVLTSLTILLLSLPLFSRKNQLQRILDDTVNSFHRITSDDYFPDQTSTLINSTKSVTSSLNLSSSSNESYCSMSSNGLNNCRRTLTSSALNLCATPVSAFRSYSTEHLQNTQNSKRLNNPSLKSMSLNAMNTSFTQMPLRSPLHMDDSLNKSFGCSTPNSFVSCATSFASRRNLLSPSHFHPMNNSQYCTAYAEVPQPQHQFYGKTMETAEKRKNFFFNNVIPHETVSRESSQSSGFESLASSNIPSLSEKMYPSQNGLRRSVDRLFTQSELMQNLENFNTCKYPDMRNKPFDVPRPQSPLTPRSNIFQSKIMDFESGDHWVRNSPMDSRESFRSEYYADHAIDRTIKSNAFDLNGMNSYLPPVRKRYNLLGNLKNNFGSGETFSP